MYHITDRPFEEQLDDLEKSIKVARACLHTCVFRPTQMTEEGLNEHEFAIGNWIIRPRFPKPQERQGPA